MRELIERYSVFVQRDSAVTQPTSKNLTEVVAVTGATGNLGAFIVAEMAQRPDVSEVWALVRATNVTAAAARLTQSFSTRGISLNNEETAKIRAIPSDLSHPDLGLAEADLGRLLESLTCIVHSAWAVNFNLGVRSFEAQHIRGTHNLINLCLRSRLPNPAKFFFCSSVSTTSSTPKPASIRESAIEDLSHAQHTGYGRSKLVTEHIVRNAMRQTGMHARVLRVGQLSGDTKTAYWNDTEAIALMVRSALTTGALPSLDEQPSWLPVDLCAKAIAQISLSPAADAALVEQDADLVYHILNPQTFSFKRDLLPALQSCGKLPPFEIVSVHQWLKRLESSEQDVEKNPSMKLVDFWRTKYGNTEDQSENGVTAQDEEPAGLNFDSTRTIQACPLLGAVRDPVRDGLIERYVEVWMKKWAA
jgi:thioester reductase-like protein